MTGASAAVGGETPTDSWQRTSTPASTIGPWLPEGDLGVRLAAGRGRVEEALRTAVGSEHAFVRETRLTLPEWQAAIEFLTAVGQKCDDTRQEFILLSDVLGVVPGAVLGLADQAAIFVG